MKRTLTLLLCLTTGICHSQQLQVLKKHIAPVKTTGQKATATQSRLIAESTRLYSNNQYVVSDSAHYWYSGDNGGAANKQIMADSSIHFTVGFSGNLEQNQFKVFSYNSNKQLLTADISSWSSINNRWVKHSKEQYTYDSQNKLITQLITSWNVPQNKYDSSEKTEYTYDSNGNLLSQTLLIWDKTKSVWEHNTRMTYTYMPNNNRATYLEEKWDNGSWLSVRNETYGYDANNNNDSIDYKTWNTVTNSWDNNALFFGMYNANNDIIEFGYKSWNKMTSQYDPAYKYINGYDANHNNIYDTLYFWNYNTKQYYVYERNFYTYNSFNQLTSDYNERYDTTSKTWGLVDVSSHYNNYYYETYNTGIPEANKLQIAIFPNPAKDIVTIQSPEYPIAVKVMNLQGQVVQTATGNKPVIQMPLHGLPAGNYIISIQTRGKSASKLITVQQ